MSVLNKCDHPRLYSALKQHTEKYLERNCPSLVFWHAFSLSFAFSEILFPKENTNLNLLLGTIWTRVVPCWIFTKLGRKAFMIIFHFRVVPDIMIHDHHHCRHHYHYRQHHNRNILISDLQVVRWSVPLTLLGTVSLASMLAFSSPPLFSQSSWSFSCEF